MIREIFFILVLSTLLIGTQACMNKGVYISLQKHQEIMCNKVPESDYESCMKEAKESYEDYQLKRDEIIKN